MVYFTLDIGLTEEQKEEVENFIKKNFVTRALHDKRMSEQDHKIEELTLLSKDSSKNKESYDKLLKDYDAMKLQLEKNQQDYEASYKKLKVDYIVRDILKKEGARNVNHVRKFLNDDALQLKEDGTVEGLMDQIQAMKKDPENSYLFYEEKIQSSKEVLPPEEPRILFRESTLSNDDFDARMNSFFGYPRRASK